MEEDKQSIYILTIACILSIFLIVFFANIYLGSNQYSESFAFDSVGQAAVIAKAPVTIRPMVTVEETPPCAYADVRSKVANSAECK